VGGWGPASRLEKGCWLENGCWLTPPNKVWVAPGHIFYQKKSIGTKNSWSQKKLEKSATNIFLDLCLIFFKMTCKCENN